MIHQTMEPSGAAELSLPMLPASESTRPADTSEPNQKPDEATAAPLDVDTSEATGNPQDSFAEQVTLPWAESDIDTPELQAIASQADTLVRRGFTLASRGATFSAVRSSTKRCACWLNRSTPRLASITTANHSLPG